jgi:uncharacterized protein with PQ loop repeat
MSFWCLADGWRHRLIASRDDGGVVIVLDVLAVVFTVARAWPQFIRIVVRRDSSGVSNLTWMLVLSAHLGWLTYGVLDHLALLIIVNTLSALGCAVIVLRLRPMRFLFGVVAGTSVASWALYEISNGVLLGALIGLSLVMLLPQVMKVVSAPHEGVSPVTWTLSALSSITWISWSIMVGRPLLGAPHYIMLPVALVILAMTLRRKRYLEPEVLAP